MAEKEANLAAQKEGKVEQQRKAKADKKSQKKGPLGGRAGDKRKAAHADHQEAWDEDAGKGVSLSLSFFLSFFLYFFGI